MNEGPVEMYSSFSYIKNMQYRFTNIHLNYDNTILRLLQNIIPKCVTVGSTQHPAVRQETPAPALTETNWIRYFIFILFFLHFFNYFYVLCISFSFCFPLLRQRSFCWWKYRRLTFLKAVVSLPKTDPNFIRLI